MTDNNSNEPKIQITETNVPENSLILFPFHRLEVEKNDLSRFLRDLKPGADTSKRDVRNLFGSIVFSFGYDDSASEVYELPEVREYIRRINAAWPCWLFYCVPAAETFTPLLWCCLQDLQVIRRKGASEVEIQYNMDELTLLILGWVPTAIQIADWAGIPRRRICLRIHHWLFMLLPSEIARDFAKSMRKFL